MPTIANPFVGNVERPMGNGELMRALRLDLASELEAIFLYEAHAQATEDPLAKKILADIRDEEREHVGELITLMRHLDPKEATDFFEGEDEVHQMMAELGIEPRCCTPEERERRKSNARK